ncbi:8-oxo-dGTP diphosphatase [Alicyclobacillus fastidiosus]|uniref:8-oxo-dGTP diphosphatase n=1 Tax=Alicyclobacillus fastidiosus TaxID=392011 RepID=A0ABY6ZIS5_9BACL|nr:8-oxo-dGTP diphosphatase [Alicyclobacillus fastidiosus]WAH42762.1 8-oxo-dGTP diphosphatase [Alicyclobacillus fastidiosus]GMA64674.1 7,8-dihydro-8-oxoguanine triphosphatase [Alicyclobacillus fastidiosus]
MDWPLPYTLCFVRRDSELLLLNRLKSPNMGVWNGLGGKIEPGESPAIAVQREVLEEAKLDIPLALFHYRGVVAWTASDGVRGGMHVFTATLPASAAYCTPMRCDEGILDFKPIEWALHKDNCGVAELLPVFLPHVLSTEPPVTHIFEFSAEVTPRFTYAQHALLTPVQLA